MNLRKRLLPKYKGVIMSQITDFLPQLQQVNVIYAKIPNYENFGIVCLTHFPIQLKRTYLGLRDSPVQKDYRFKISIPLADEKIALDIEENIKNCSLLFVFKIQRTEEKETEFIKQDFILGKISNVYLVNNNTGFIYKKW